MGILNLFAKLALSLQSDPSLSNAPALEQLVAGQAPFAYIGNRASLRESVLSDAVALQARILKLSPAEILRASAQRPELANYIENVRARLSQNSIVSDWLGREWEKDSGVFPDFLLALDSKPTFGNGALLELKDSKGAAISSFNSTIPTRYKSLEDTRRIAGSRLVSHAAELFDFALSAEPDYLSRLRTCFYLIRTFSRSQTKVRISLVEGSFFETLPKDKLMELVWGQILDAGGLTGAVRDQVIELLAQLEQREIAQSRDIDGASIRLRFRMMAEAHKDGNVNRYPEIQPCSVNLVVKMEQRMLEELVGLFAVDGMHAKLGEDAKNIQVHVQDKEIQFHISTILHKRNGEHLVLSLGFDRR